jgi:hypothetical protein
MQNVVYVILSLVLLTAFTGGTWKDTITDRTLVKEAKIMGRQICSG